MAQFFSFEMFSSKKRSFPARRRVSRTFQPQKQNYSNSYCFYYCNCAASGQAASESSIFRPIGAATPPPRFLL